MPTLFTKPIHELTAEDVAGIITWPESLTVEFKRELPTKEGRPDPWLGGGKVGDVARDKLLKEVVALANTVGGHLVLGIDEDRSVSPRTASKILPVPRCVDLAERLSQMAQHIDPPVPLLLVRGIPTEGDSGVVLFRVPQSRAAPHRSPDLQCYIRRGTESVPIGMREIRDMAISAGRESGWSALRLAQSRMASRQQINKQQPPATCIRVAAVPLMPVIALGRLFEKHESFRATGSLLLNLGTTDFRLDLPRVPTYARPAVRGVKYTYDQTDFPNSLELYSDGFCSFDYRAGVPSQYGPRVYMTWLTMCLVNVLLGVNFLRRQAEMPELEYELEVELLGAGDVTSMAVHGWGSGFDDAFGVVQTPLSLPSVSYGPESEMKTVLSTVLTDLRDVCGSYIREPISVEGLRLP